MSARGKQPVKMSTKDQNKLSTVDRPIKGRRLFLESSLRVQEVSGREVGGRANGRAEGSRRFPAHLLGVEPLFTAAC